MRNERPIFKMMAGSSGSDGPEMENYKQLKVIELMGEHVLP